MFGFRKKLWCSIMPVELRMLVLILCVWKTRLFLPLILKIKRTMSQATTFRSYVFSHKMQTYFIRNFWKTLYFSSTTLHSSPTWKWRISNDTDYYSTTIAWRVLKGIRNWLFFTLKRPIFVPTYIDQSNYKIKIFKTVLGFSFCLL